MRDPQENAVARRFKKMKRDKEAAEEILRILGDLEERFRPKSSDDPSKNKKRNRKR